MCEGVYKNDTLTTKTRDDMEITFTLDWDQYKLFYNGYNFQSKHRISMSINNRCRNTTLLEQIETSQKLEKPQTGGKRRHKRSFKSLIR